jgi:hypothetical protein
MNLEATGIALIQVTVCHTKEGVSLPDTEPFPEYIYSKVPASSQLLRRLKKFCGRKDDDIYEVPSSQVVEIFGLLSGVPDTFDITRCMLKERAAVIHGDRKYFDNVINAITGFNKNLTVNKYIPSLRYQLSGYFDPNKKYLLSELKERHKYVSGIGTYQNFVPAYEDSLVRTEEEKCSYCNRKDCFDLFIEEACLYDTAFISDWQDIEPQEVE